MDKYLIPVIDESNEIVDCVEFIDNLTRNDVPDYLNFNGHIGLTRCKSERNNGRLVLCFFYPEKQKDSYAEFISEVDALNMCKHRNKLDVAYQLQLQVTKDREVL